jgi:hypothetical protein
MSLCDPVCGLRVSFTEELIEEKSRALVQRARVIQLAINYSVARAASIFPYILYSIQYIGEIRTSQVWEYKCT